MKTAIAPIITLIILVLNNFFNTNISQDETTLIINGLVILISAAWTFWGIIKNHFPHKENPQA